MAQAPEDRPPSQSKPKRFPADQPYALALIDGDSYVFNHDFRNSPVSGMSQMAQTLFDCMTRRIAARHGEIKCFANIYLYQNGLATALKRYRHAKTAGAVSTWMDELAQSDSRLRIFDVGKGEDLADKKIIANLRVHINRPNCVEIILGGTHDNGYLDVLTKYDSSPLGEKVTLLTAWATRGRFLKLKFEIISWPEVFRDKALKRDPKNDSDALPLTKSRMGSVPRLQFTVRTTSRETITIDVDANGTILSLKEELHLRLGGRSSDEWWLTYRRKAKHDNEKIKACEFEGNPVVYIFHIVCGGKGGLSGCSAHCARSPASITMDSEWPVLPSPASATNKPATPAKDSPSMKKENHIAEERSAALDMMEQMADLTVSNSRTQKCLLGDPAITTTPVKIASEENLRKSPTLFTEDALSAPNVTFSSSGEESGPST